MHTKLKINNSHRKTNTPIDVANEARERETDEEKKRHRAEAGKHREEETTAQ